MSSGEETRNLGQCGLGWGKNFPWLQRYIREAKAAQGEGQAVQGFLGTGPVVRFYVCPEGCRDLERTDSNGPEAYHVRHDPNKMKNFWTRFILRRLQAKEEKLKKNGCLMREQIKKHR